MERHIEEGHRSAPSPAKSLLTLVSLPRLPPPRSPDNVPTAMSRLLLLPLLLSLILSSSATQDCAAFLKLCRDECCSAGAPTGKVHAISCTAAAQICQCTIAGQYSSAKGWKPRFQASCNAAGLGIRLNQGYGKPCLPIRSKHTASHACKHSLSLVLPRGAWSHARRERTWSHECHSHSLRVALVLICRFPVFLAGSLHSLHSPPLFRRAASPVGLCR